MRCSCTTAQSEPAQTDTSPFLSAKFEEPMQDVYQYQLLWSPAVRTGNYQSKQEIKIFIQTKIKSMQSSKKVVVALCPVYE
jgi:hypothetical protein